MQSETPPTLTLSTANQWTFVTAKGASWGAVALQIWEFFGTFPEEVELIWLQSRTSTTLLYLWSRYFPLMAQAVHLTLDDYFYSPFTNTDICLAALLMKATLSQLTLSCVELILLMRVYKLYNCTRQIRYFLTAIYVCGTSCEVTGSMFAIVHLIKSDEANACNIGKPDPYPLILYGVGAGLTQGVVCIMTFVQSIRTRYRLFSRTPLSSVMLKDGVVVFLVLLILLSTIFSVEVVGRLPTPFWDTAFAWYISLLSIAGCRLILNMRRLAIPSSNDNEAASGPEFTSVMYTGPSELELEQ